MGDHVAVGLEHYAAKPTDPKDEAVELASKRDTLRGRQTDESSPWARQARTQHDAGGAVQQCTVPRTMR